MILLQSSQTISFVALYNVLSNHLNYIRRLTFFAPPDRVLRQSNFLASNNLSFLRTQDVTNGSLEYSLLSSLSQLRDLAGIVDLIEESTSGISRAAKDGTDQQVALKTILRAILSYHIVPKIAYDLASLENNVTYPTQLRVPGAFAGKPLRLRVAQNALLPTVNINFATKILHPDIKVTNGTVCVFSCTISSNFYKVSFTSSTRRFSFLGPCFKSCMHLLASSPRW